MSTLSSQSTMKRHHSRSTFLPDAASFRRTVCGSLPLAFFLSLPLAVFLSRLDGLRLRTPGSVRCCGPKCRERIPDAETHYDEKYFAWQTKLGKEKAAEQNWNTLLATRPTDVVADLGAGGGHILAVLNVSKRIAVEINPQAREAMKRMYPSIQAYVYPENVPDDSLDLLFSTSAIEHFECPLTELREMARKVKVGGRIAIGVKNEGVQCAGDIKKNDINQHIWTWNRQLLYNLVTRAGFRVHKVDPPVDVILRKVKTWNTTNHFKGYEVFVYHWAHGVKEPPKLKEDKQ